MSIQFSMCQNPLNCGTLYRALRDKIHLLSTFGRKPEAVLIYPSAKYEISLVFVKIKMTFYIFIFNESHISFGIIEKWIAFRLWAYMLISKLRVENHKLYCILWKIIETLLLIWHIANPSHNAIFKKNKSILVIGVIRHWSGDITKRNINLNT